MHFRPISDIIKISTLVHSIKINESLWAFPGGLIPNLAKDANVDGAHELLAENVQTMSLVGVSA